MLALQAAALASSLLHALVDVRIAVFGGGTAISAGQAAVLVTMALLFAWWALLLAFTARRDVLWALAALAGLWAGFANGLIGFAFCFPPCVDAFPLGDLSHLGSLVFGAWGALVTARAARGAAGPEGWGLLAITLVLVAASFVLQATNFTVP